MRTREGHQPNKVDGHILHPRFPARGGTLSALEDVLATQLALVGFRGFKREFCAIAGRRFRWDFAWPDHRLLVEVQGGTWGKRGTGGHSAHSGGAAAARDAEKLNLAAIHGWTVMHFTTDQIRKGQALRWIQDFFRRRAA